MKQVLVFLFVAMLLAAGWLFVSPDRVFEPRSKQATSDTRHERGSSTVPQATAEHETSRLVSAGPRAGDPQPVADGSRATATLAATELDAAARDALQVVNNVLADHKLPPIRPDARIRTEDVGPLVATVTALRKERHRASMAYSDAAHRYTTPMTEELIACLAKGIQPPFDETTSPAPKTPNEWVSL